MDGELIGLALKLAGGESAMGAKSIGTLRSYLRSTAITARATADFLDSIAADLGTPDRDASHVPGAKPLSYAEVKSVWDGVSKPAKRLLGAFALYGGQLGGAVTPQQLMKALGVDEARRLNGPLGGISRRVKKLLGDPDAAFYSIHPDDGRYVLPQATFDALCDVVDKECPEWLANDSWITSDVAAEADEGGSDE